MELWSSLLAPLFSASFSCCGKCPKRRNCYQRSYISDAKLGFCKESEFEVTEQTENSITFLLKANEETQKHYPYHFELRLAYHLNGSTLSMDYRVTNKDYETMYYHIGAHPGFSVRSILGKILKIVFWDLKKKKILSPTNMTLRIWNLILNTRYSKKQKAIPFRSQFQCLIRMLFSLKRQTHIAFLS